MNSSFWNTRFLNSSRSFYAFRNNSRIMEEKSLKEKKQPPGMFYKKAVLKNFAIFTKKHLCWSLFLIKLQAERHPKRGSNTDVLMWIFQEHLLWRASANVCLSKKDIHTLQYENINKWSKEQRNIFLWLETKWIPKEILRLWQK